VQLPVSISGNDGPILKVMLLLKQKPDRVSKISALVN
jgi:hypothetical protein